MTTLRPAAFLSLILPLILAVPAAAQAQSAAAGDASRTVGCAGYCYRVALPLGLYVKEVLEDGRYVMLEDESVWEIRLPSVRWPPAGAREISCSSRRSGPRWIATRRFWLTETTTKPRLG